MSQNISNKRCCVPKCQSRKLRNIHFHSFPKGNSDPVPMTNHYGNVEMVSKKKAWEIALGLKIPAGSIMYVCSLHFSSNDYMTGGEISPRLKYNAIPSKKIPKTLSRMSSFEKMKEVRLQRYKRRVLLREHSKEHIESPMAESEHYGNGSCNDQAVDEVFDDVSNEDLTSEELQCIEGLLTLKNSSNISGVDKAVQVASGDFNVSFTSLIQDNSQLNALTGLGNFEILSGLVTLLTKFYPDKKVTKLSHKDRVIIVFMKLKTGLTFKIISFLFKISQATVRKIFDTFVSYLANILQSQIRWPTKEEISRNRPTCFQNFKSCRIILDCTEIPVQMASCLCCRIKTYSHYKGHQTLKFMVGVTPGGLISFVSKVYGGRVSDKAIFEQSNIISMLEPHDSVMVDKGFLIEDICSSKQVSLIRPHFLRKKSQFSAEEANFNVEVSRARVHVERVNQRIKRFEIFHNPLPWNLVNKIDEIILIVCAIVNLQPPILADDKF